MASALKALAHPRRLATLTRSGLLDTPMEEAFDRLTRMAAQLLHASASLISLVDSERQFFKSVFGLPEPWATLRETPLTHSFCQHIVATRAPLIIEDARKDPLVRGNLAVQDLGVISYLGIPLRMSNKEILGSFCVIDNKPRHWTQGEIQLLTDLTASVVAEIELRLALHTTDEILDIATHDLKNPLAAIIMTSDLLLQQASRTSMTLQRSARSLERIHNCGIRIRNVVQGFLMLRAFETGRIKLDRQRRELEDVLAEAISATSGSFKEKEMELDFAPSGGIQLEYDYSSLVQAFTAVLGCMAELGPEGSRIEVRIWPDPKNLCEVRFNNPSLHLNEKDIALLFNRSGESAIPLKKGSRLIFQLAREVVDIHGGSISMKSSQESGTTVNVSLPTRESMTLAA